MQISLLTDMMLFLAVVEKQSFTAAAKQFNLNKSVVSKRITQLERSLGAQLLYRSTRRLALSEVGETLYLRCLKIHEDLKHAEQVIKASQVEPQGRLRIAAPDSFCQPHLIKAAADYMRKYPKVQVEIASGITDVDPIEHSVDLAIKIGELPDSSLLAKQLTIRKMRVCASPDYLDKQGVPRTPAALREHNCLTHNNSPTGQVWQFQSGRKPMKVSVNGNFSASSSQILAQAAVTGLGVVMLPGYMMTEDVKSGRLISLLDNFCQEGVGVYAVFNQTKFLAPKLRAFIDFIHHRFSNEQYWY